jgi:hypothetical protein
LQGAIFYHSAFRGAQYTPGVFDGALVIYPDLKSYLSDHEIDSIDCLLRKFTNYSFKKYMTEVKKQETSPLPLVTGKILPR